jgi:spore germination cell wall hydrolase CwlJ-like protein
MSSILVCIAMAVYFEARGEPIAGQLAVAQVVLNRVDDDRHPDNACDVVYEAKKTRGGKIIRNMCQFSFYCDGKPESVNDGEAWKAAINVARVAMTIPLDVSQGATHYHAVYVDPTWRYTMRLTTQIGRHAFYRN